MTNKALVIQDTHAESFDASSFLAARNLVAKYCNTGPSAILAIQTTRYRCIVVSMEMANEDPLEIIGSLRRTENELGLPANPILVVSESRLPTHDEVLQLKISGQIRSHNMK